MRITGSRQLIWAGIIAFYSIAIFGLFIAFMYAPVNFLNLLLALTIVIGAVYLTIKVIQKITEIKYCTNNQQLHREQFVLLNIVCNTFVFYAFLIAALYNRITAGAFNQEVLMQTITVFMKIVCFVVPIIYILENVIENRLHSTPVFSKSLLASAFLVVAWLCSALYLIGSKAQHRQDVMIFAVYVSCVVFALFFIILSITGFKHNLKRGAGIARENPWWYGVSGILLGCFGAYLLYNRPLSFEYALLLGVLLYYYLGLLNGKFNSSI